MPELPEVETVVRDLRPLLVGRRISAVAAGSKPLRKKWSPDWEPHLIGRRVGEVRRRGKWIVVALERGPFLVIHLGMTGQLTVARSGAPAADHVHLTVGLDRGRRQLRFRDIRRFGSAAVYEDAARLDEFFRGAGLGPEPFDLRPGDWKASLAGTARCLKAVLLDQRVVAGVGNIYADESLFEAHLHPARLGRSLAPPEAERLRKAVVKVLRRAIEQRGSSIRDYVGGSGLKGRYQEEFRAYGQTGRPCPRCRTPIARVRLAGRSTHFCPRCQRP